MLSEAWSRRSGPIPGRRILASGIGITRKERLDKSPKVIIDLLVDIVSRNGNLLDESGLKIQLPVEKPGSHAFPFKIDGLDLR